MDEEAPFFELSDTKNFIRVTVLRKSYPDAADNWDNNWVDATIKVKAGPFTGTYNVQLRIIDFQFFRKELRTIYDNLTGQAKFEDIDRYLSINMKGDGAGHFETYCTLMCDPGAEEITLKFNLHPDQTQIMPIVRQLDNILAVFPVIGGLRKG